MSMTLPNYQASILSSDLSEDNNFRQWIALTEYAFTSAGWSETTDAGYCQPFLNNMAFGTVVSYAGGVSTGTYAPSTSSSNQQYYPNNAMSSATYSAGTYYQSYGQPTANSVHYCVGYDNGTQNGSVTALSYKLGFSSAATTDISSWTIEGLTATSANNPDGNFDWAQASWTVLDSHVGLVANGSGSLTLSSVPVTTAGSGYVINTTATITSTHGVGAVVQPVVSGGAISGNIIVCAGIGYAVNDALTFSGAGTGATAYVSSVNGAGQITAIVVSAGGSSYVANPICVNSVINTSSSTPVFAVFLNSANGTAGGVNQIIPAPFSSATGTITNPTGYTSGTYGTPTVTQTGGSSAVIGTPTAIVQSSANIFNIPLPLTTTSTTFRAFRIRVTSAYGTAGNGVAPSVNLYNWILYSTQNAATGALNLTPTRLAPANGTPNVTNNWKIFYMGDSIQTASGSAGCPLYAKICWGSSTTWNYPAMTIQMGQGTDGAGNLIGSQTTAIMSATTGAASVMAIQPFWFNGNTDWFHAEFFKGTTNEICLHIERNQTSVGADDPTSGVTALVATANSIASSVVMPQLGSAPSVESKWSAVLGVNAGSTLGPYTQIVPVSGRNYSWTYPLRRLWVCETASGLPDGTVTSIIDSYSNTVSAYVGGVKCTTVAQSQTTGRILVKNTQ